MRASINTTLLTLFIKMFATLIVVVSLLAMSASAEADSYSRDQTETHTVRLEGQLRSSIAFEASFDKESIFLDINNSTIYIAGDLTSAQQRQNLIKFLTVMAPEYALVDNTKISDKTAAKAQSKVAKLLNWVSI